VPNQPTAVLFAEQRRPDRQADRLERLMAMDRLD
jgi:hypothetical protein